MLRNLNNTILAITMASAAVACGDDVGMTTDMGPSPTPDGGGMTTPDMGMMAGCTNAMALAQSDITCASGVCTVPAGNYAGAIAFDAGNEYLLAGRVFMGDGTTDCAAQLTIAAGVTVRGSNAMKGYLAVQPNSTIEAIGTAASPIVFTSDSMTPARGDWGGIIISGNATVNCGGAGTTCNGEGDTGAYGGMDDTDSSGTLRYVRIEYGGNQVNATDELNGLALQGVGSGTTLEYIHVHKSKDDGYEFFGGTVDAKWIISTGIGDDSIDWTFGWRGRVQYAIVQQHADEADNGIEADNNGDDNTASPRSNPIISNITLIGSPNSTESDIGMLLRAGTGGQIWNAVVFAFNDAGLDIDDAETHTNASAAAGNLAVAHSVMCNATNFKDDMGDAFTDTDFFTMGGSFGSVNNEAVAGFPNCGLMIGTDATNETAPNFTPGTGSQLANGGAQPSDAWFDTVTFRGAVMPGAPMTGWYSWTQFN